MARQETDDTMLKATKHEREHILGYMLGEAPDETVQLAQKVYSEQVHTVKHDIWDVHTDRGRWWVITNPTKLYSQEQFPNMDLALTFHIGLCMRIPRSEEPSPATSPLGRSWRAGEPWTRRMKHSVMLKRWKISRPWACAAVKR